MKGKYRFFTGKISEKEPIIIGVKFNSKYKYCFVWVGVTGNGLFQDLISRAEFPSFFLYKYISHAFGSSGPGY